MKKLFTLLSFVMLFGANSYSQCFSGVTVQTIPCDSLCSGVAVWTFGGGVMPYSLWINGSGPFQATSAFTQGNLCPGIYNYLVVDAGGDTCSGLNSFVVPVGIPVSVTLNVVNATCAICNDGAVSATATGGSAPYSFQWSQGSTTSSIGNLSPGIYYLYTTDANGCTTTDTAIVGVGNNGYYALLGQVYFDSNNNGLKDVGEPGVANQAITVPQGPITALTNFQGDYVFVVGPGTFDANFVGAPGWNLTSSPASYNNTITTTSVSGLDFGVYPDSTFLGASTYLYSGFPRCFWDIPYYLSIYNSGFTTLSGTLTFTHDLNLTYLNSSIPPSSSAGNVYSYNFSNLGPSQSFNVMVTMTEPAGGTILNSSLATTATDNLGNQFADNKALTQTTSCSYDPNDKSVQPSGVGALNYVATDSWLDYQIRFQNTGNDTAFTVIVLDTLDAGLDLSTFTLIGASHPVDVTMRPNREVSFRFDNILLPDSIVDEPGSHGYVLYRIKGNGTNPDPTSVFNTAYIYFDLNLPVITNTTLTTFSDNFLGIADASGEEQLFSLFPNPMSNGAMLKYEGKSTTAISVELMDLSGRIVKPSQIMQNNTLLITNKGLSPGTYLVKIKSNSVSYLRLVVQ